MRTRTYLRKHGMALVIVLIAMLCFSIVMFGIAQQQQHETRWTAISIEQQRAFILADAGLSRALARHIAKPYADRWYGRNPRDDLLPALNHSGRFNESSQGVDEGAGGGPPAADRKLDRNGTYEVMVEDRHVGEFAANPSPPPPDVKVMFTDVYSKGTVEGPRGKPVNVLLFGRIAIAPEVPYFDASPSPSPSPSGSAPPPVVLSTPEMVKRLIRYKVYFAPDLADGAIEQPNADTVKVRTQVHDEIAQFHQNFLKNRNTFKDFRDPAKVPPNWQEGTATQRAWSRDQINQLFAGIAGPADVPPGNNNPNPNPPGPGTFHNLWTDTMLRRYRVSDLVLANTGFKYLIPATDLSGQPLLPSASQTRILDNILRVFYAPETLKPIDPRFLEGGTPPITDGNELIDLQSGGAQSVQAVIDQPREDYNRHVACWERVEAAATILLSHWDPFPTPSPMPSPKPPIAQAFDGQDFFKKKFENETLTPAVIGEMQAEIDRANGMLGTPELSYATYIGKRGKRDQPFPIVLRYDAPAGGGGPAGPPPQIAVDELVKFYSKYIESTAAFSTGDPGDISPVPPVPTTPPSETPPPQPNPGNNGGGGGGGSSRPGGYGIGGAGAGS